MWMAGRINQRTGGHAQWEHALRDYGSPRGAVRHYARGMFGERRERDR
jgi:hypothetical protein